MKVAVSFILLLVASGICTTLARNGNNAEKESCHSPKCRQAGAAGQASNFARWQERMNGGAGNLVPDRRLGKLEDRFNAARYATGRSKGMDVLIIKSTLTSLHNKHIGPGSSWC